MSTGSRENKQNKVRTQLWDTLYVVSKVIKNIFKKQNIYTSGSQHLDFDTGSHNSAPQVTRNIRRIHNRFNVIVLNVECLLDIKGAF